MYKTFLGTIQNEEIKISANRDTERILKIYAYVIFVTCGLSCLHKDILHVQTKVQEMSQFNSRTIAKQFVINSIEE